tara:strand:+ start:293 stop:1369 length:1077 start_codon:yes stop_codon:yes gene_type:complete
MAREIYSASYVVFIYAFGFYFLSEYIKRRSQYSIFALCVFFTTILPGNNLVLNIANETILWSLLLLKKYCDGRKNWHPSDVVVLFLITLSYETSPIVLISFLAFELKQKQFPEALKNPGVRWLGSALIFTVFNIVRMAFVEETRKMPHMELYFTSLLDFLKRPAHYVHFIPYAMMSWLALSQAMQLKKEKTVDIILIVALSFYGVIIFEYGGNHSFTTAYLLRTISVPLALILVLFATNIQQRRLEIFLLLMVAAHGSIDARASIKHHQAWLALLSSGERGCQRIGDLDQLERSALSSGGIFGHSIALESIVRSSPVSQVLFYDQNSRLLLDDKGRCRRVELNIYGPTRRIGIGHLVK